MNQVVARFQDGTTLKGHTNDFVPTKDSFHLTPFGAAIGAKPVEVRMKELKALYFVRSLFGDPEHQESNHFPPLAPSSGRRMQVTFKDGEILVGITQGYQSSRPGFFLVPADPLSNNERCYVVAGATQSVAFL
jgi:hypothetical protein